MTARNAKAATIGTLLSHQQQVLAAARRFCDQGIAFASGDLYQFMHGVPANNPATRGNRAAGIGRTLRLLAHLGLLNRCADNAYCVPRCVPAKVRTPSFITPPTKAQLMAGRAYP